MLKIDKDTGAIKLYKNTKLFLFARKKEQFDYEIKGNIKKQWLTNDICGLTYKDQDGNLREFVVTYGDRGNGISYYYVESALSGEWNGRQTQIIVDSKGITIVKDSETYFFEHKDCKQYGTIALVLHKDDIPKYVIALNQDCELDEKTDIIKKGGTISLSEISMKKTKTETLLCVTPKNFDLSDYNIVGVSKGKYQMKNGIMYVNINGKNTIEVPGDFSEMRSNMYTKYNYQIAEEKTFFYYTSNFKEYIVYSDNMGKDWNTVEIENKPAIIQNIHFINTNIGFMLSFDDAVVGTALGKIRKTTNGGENWEDINYGIGEGEEKTFSRGSQIKFIDEVTGFLTMPSTSGEYSELYVTTDGGYTFSKLQILESDIYDYYNMPTYKNHKLRIKITQGTDGYYNGGDYKEYYSNDKGRTWKIDA